MARSTDSSPPEFFEISVDGRSDTTLERRSSDTDFDYIDINLLSEVIQLMIIQTYDSARARVSDTDASAEAPLYGELFDETAPGRERFMPTKARLICQPNRGDRRS